ncbi:MAG: hypothetical protein DMF38_14945, partial [Verrucomicrobia bacterium]
AGAIPNPRSSCVPAALGIENGLLYPRLDNIEATLGHYEVILHSDVFVIVGIDRSCEPGVDAGACHLLLGGRGA